MKVAFRADASVSIGAGHVRRCEALARELVERGAEVAFVCRTMPGDLNAWLRGRGHAVHVLPLAPTAGATEDAEATRALLERDGPIDWVVVDHYGLDASFERSWRRAGTRVLAIDDLPTRTHDCDALLDQNLHHQPRAVGAVATTLFGPRYALLAPPYAALRMAGIAPRPTERVRRVLVCFGGSDPGDHTGATLEAIAPHVDRLEHVEVALGAAHASRAAIDALCRRTGARLLPGSDDLAAAIAAADLVIGAGGTMSWERACLGAPSLVFGVADNQAPVIDALLEGGYAIGLPSLARASADAVRPWIEAAIASPSLLRGLGLRAATLCDGRGVQRVADRLYPIPLRWRAATMDDAAALLAWRNHAENRVVSRDPRTIDAQEHAVWLEGVLKDPQRVLLVAEGDAGPVGVVRFDCRDREAEISLYRVPGSRPERVHLLERAVAWLAAQRPQVRRLSAVVLPQNARSVEAFRRAGFEPGQHHFVREMGAKP
jgi:UDP-2,4-diacetamido-2,4,6-trideoxy-beta-L-altropyranose hydrolase